MARYGSGASKAGVNTANTPYFSVRNTSAALRIEVRQIIVAVAVAPTTAPAFYLSRTTANGTETTSLAGQAYDPADAASLALFVSAWSVNPTFSTTAWLGNGALALTAGGAFIWTFYDKPLTLSAATTTGIAVVNANASGATTGTFHGSALWDE